MPELGWRDAIIQVLRGSSEAMHYADIAETITEKGYRTSVGATPAITVNSIISKSINDEGIRSPFIRVDTGRYWLRDQAQRQAGTQDQPGSTESTDDQAVSAAGLINAFGMYWVRSQVLWATVPKLLGQQQTASKTVDFAQQKGVYLLHDSRAVVYVGRTTEQPLGVRLRQHNVDRLNGRWDRFSWFGVYPVSEETGVLNTTEATQYDLSILIATMEALLIEGLEPPQNRKRGDDFRAVEFLQVLDPELQKTEILKLMDALKAKL
jgi:hypothetical protein